MGLNGGLMLQAVPVEAFKPPEEQRDVTIAAFGQRRFYSTVHLEFHYKNCPSPGELFHFAFAHESGTLTGTDVTQPSVTDMLR